LEAIAAGLDPEFLIPQVPENCYVREFAETLRLEVIKALETYSLMIAEKCWENFKKALAEYLKRVTGALCASAETLEDFQAIADLNGYKPGWAYYRHQQKKNHVRN
jgi:hypothetical protein